MRKVKFNDLQSHNYKYKQEFGSALKKVLKSGWLVLGNEVQRFEKEFAKYVGAKYGVGVASGTDAIILSLQALNLKPDDEVIIPVNVYPVAFAVASAGFKFKLVDIDPYSYNLDVKDLEKKVNGKTKVIIVVHLYGRAAELGKILAFAKKKKLIVIEDCSQAHGTKYRNKRVGSFGSLSIFSLYPTKNLGALGDGGIVTTNQKRLADKIIAMRQYGEVKRYESRMLGRVSRLDEIQAAFLRIKLKKIGVEINKRVKKANVYLKNLNGVEEVILPVATKKLSHSYHLFVIRCKNRNKLIKYLAKNGIQTGIHYPLLINKIPIFSGLKYSKNSFPNAKFVNKEILSLPFYPDMKVGDIEYVCSIIKKFYQKTKK